MPQFLKQDNSRAFLKTAFHEHRGSLKFASLYKESPCSPVVSFPSFGLEGHGVQLAQGGSFFPHLCSTSLMFFRTIVFFYLLNQAMSVLKTF